MNLNRFLRTTSFRLVAFYTAMFAVSITLLFALIYWFASSALTQQLRAGIDAEIAALASRYDKEGLSDLAGGVSERLKLGGRLTPFYLVQDRKGRKLAGNLGATQPFAGWRELAVPESLVRRLQQGAKDEFDGAILSKGRLLPGGVFLLVGADRSRVHEMEEAIIGSFTWVAGIALLLAVVGGALISAGFLRRVDVINRTSREIVAGNLSDRVPIRGADDEMDRLAENINDMLDRIQALMEGVRQVTNDIAHDLRTPLSRLKQRLEAARGEASTLEDYDRAIEGALVDADAALATFGALLRIAQIESGSRRKSFAEVDLSQTFEAVISTYRPVAEDLGKTLDTEISPGILVLGDRDLLVQMLVNLLENALCHTPERALVSVSLGAFPNGPVAVVADNGAGIPEAEHQKVFQRFYRLDRSRSTTGSGLGLALVAAVAELHRIAVRLEDNNPGLRVVLDFAG